MRSDKQNRENIFHERADLLKEKSYLGYSVIDAKTKWDGVQITAQKNNGKTVKAWGETIEEAYQNAIDNIDQSLDEPG
ncbi:hypothetical protein [Fodinibius saliphilus]|uniref:hypothetical protein n=1 Tax=Fodinibius saliphilus TaxID=1920650 RepID=UPI001109852B|nr:hypothetical protein [Fodinibius saliphilus]